MPFEIQIEVSMMDTEAGRGKVIPHKIATLDSKDEATQLFHKLSDLMGNINAVIKG